jgi:hypothetical protein
MTRQGDAIKNALINIQQNTSPVLDFTEIAIDVFGNPDGRNNKHVDKDTSDNSITWDKVQLVIYSLALLLFCYKFK